MMIGEFQSEIFIFLYLLHEFTCDFIWVMLNGFFPLAYKKGLKMRESSGPEEHSELRISIYCYLLSCALILL